MMRPDRPARGLAVLLVASSLAVVPGACTVGHKRVGNTVRASPEAEIVIGTTTRAEILRVFGAPDRLIRRPEGDAFLYVHEREESRAFRLREPVVTRQDIYSWSNIDARSDRLLILFDENGRVTSYGFRRGTDEFDEEPDDGEEAPR